MFVASVAGARPSAALVDELVDATGGNPFLLRSVVSRHLASGRLTARDGALELGREGRLVAPVDLDDEIRLLLDGVDAASMRVLTVAALLGDGAGLDELDAVHRRLGGDAGGAATSVGEAVERGILAADGDAYRFSHPQIRHVLAHRPAASEREELHRTIAGALVDHHGGRSTEQALRIAHHLERGGTPVDPASALEWALRAGAAAWAASAWTRALRAYDAALAWAVDPSAEDRNEWMLRGAIAAYMAHDRASADRLRDAIAVARDRGDLHRWADAVLLLARFSAEDVGGQIGRPPDTGELEALLEALGDGEPALRVRTLATLSEAYAIAMQLERAERYEREAERVLASSSERDAAAVVRLGIAIGNRELRQLRFAAARAQLARARAVDDGGRQPDLVTAAETRLGLIDVASGELQRAGRALERVRGDRLRAVGRERQLASAVLATATAAQGELAQAERLAGEAIALYRLHEYVFTPGIAYPVAIGCRAMRGDVRGALDAVEEWADEGGRGTWRYRALVDAWTRGAEGVDAQVSSRPWRLPADLDLLTLDIPCIHVELARVVGRPEAAEHAIVMLEEAHERGACFTIGWPWSVARMLGEAWLLLEKPDEAIRWFTAADRACGRAGARLDQARARLGLARAAVLSGQLPEAMAHAEQAATVLDALGALTFARQARAVCSDAGAGAGGPRPALRAVLVTDLGGSTALNVRAGDELYVQVLAEHDRIIRGRLADHGGVEFKHTGDGLCAWFASASDAVHCALGVRDDLERLSALQPETRLAVRIGVAAGEPVDVGDDLFGLTVVVAARMCDMADPGHVYVAEEVARLTRGKPFDFEQVGSFELKGMPGTTTVFEALRHETDPPKEAR
jgi:class 3 adenylate cyclase